VSLERGCHIIVSAAVIADGSVLVVRQPGPDGPGTVWALPGGRVDKGELAVDAVRREVAEETSFQLASAGRLVGIGQMVNPTEIRRDPGELPGPGETATVFLYVFAVAPSLVSGADDPDAEIAEVRWVPADEAVQMIERHPFPFMRTISRDAILAAIDSTLPVQVHYFRRTETGADIEVY
jgi:ADP-ribose pyrophosphatase YjhB (NUDIX family)